MAGQKPGKQELQEAFNMIDKNGDGTISTNELKTIMTSLGMNTSDKDLKELMKKVDVDKTNTINFQEFVTMMESMKPDPDKLLRDQFRVLDKDKSGFISVSELRDLAKTMGLDMTKPEVEEMMKDNDLNQDGKLNFEEFKKIMTS